MYYEIHYTSSIIKSMPKKFVQFVVYFLRWLLNFIFFFGVGEGERDGGGLLVEMFEDECDGDVFGRWMVYGWKPKSGVESGWWPIFDSKCFCECFGWWLGWSVLSKRHNDIDGSMPMALETHTQTHWNGTQKSAWYLISFQSATLNGNISSNELLNKCHSHQHD